MEVGAVEVVAVTVVLCAEFVNILLNYRGSQAQGMGDMMKQALQ